MALVAANKWIGPLHMGGLGGAQTRPNSMWLNVGNFRPGNYHPHDAEGRILWSELTREHTSQALIG